MACSFVRSLKRNNIVVLLVLVIIAQPLVAVMPLSSLTLLDSGAASIVINEILFDPHGGDAGNEWIELYNADVQAVDISGWTISNRTGLSVAALPNWIFPNGTYLVVHFGVGTNDNDFSDGEGDYYTGNILEVFNNTEDEVALYNGTPSNLTIVDFVSYCFDGEYSPGVAHDYAVSATIWDSSDFFSLLSPAQPFLLIYPMVEGDTIGRDKDSTDTNQPEDWNGHGGADALGPTPGAVNYHSMIITPPPPPPPPWPQPHKSWTVMVYMDSDGNLESPWLYNINKMELAGSDANVNIVVQIHLVSEFGGKTCRSYIEQDGDMNKWSSKKVSVEPKPDMGAPDTLTDFINWTMTNFPADHYALFIAGHGQGWKGTLISDRLEGRGLRMWELSCALDPFARLDAVVFYSCMMGMIEVAYQIHSNAMTMVASQEVTLTVFPFDTFFAKLKLNSTWSAEDFAREATVQFNAALKNLENSPYPLIAYFATKRTTSAIKLSVEFQNLVNMVDGFGNDTLALNARHKWGIDDYNINDDPNDNVQINIKNCRSVVESYFDRSFIDLYHFAELIEADGSIPSQYKTQAPLIKAALVKDAEVILEEKSPNRPDSHGLSIYFPIDQNVSRYAFDKPWPSRLDGAFSSLAIYAEDKTTEWGLVPDDHPYPETPDLRFRNTKWDEFLHRYYKPVADAGEDRFVCVGKPITFRGCGSSDSDGNVKRYIWDFDDTNTRIPGDSLDWDKDGKDELNDDKNKEGHIVTWTFTQIGVYIVTLTVWDDHHIIDPNHYKTDQDQCTVVVSWWGDFDGDFDIDIDDIRYFCSAYIEYWTP